MLLQAVNSEVFGDFTGSDLNILSCEALIQSRWGRKEILAERGLLQDKWWDYRLLHPVHSTYYFAHVLDCELRAIIRAYVNDAPARTTETGRLLDWYAIKPGDVFQPPNDPKSVPYWKRKIVGLIRARQIADSDGIPYDLFCREGLKHFYLGGGSYMLARARIPEVNWLYSDACLLVIRKKWVEQMEMWVQTAKHPIYRLPNDDGHIDRTQHRDWLMQQLDGRGTTSRAHAYARLVKEQFLN
jgi:hypothetical protein